MRHSQLLFCASSEERGTAEGSVARLVGVSEGQRGEGWELFLPQNFSLSLSSERLPWLLPGHRAALEQSPVWLSWAQGRPSASGQVR